MRLRAVIARSFDTLGIELNVFHWNDTPNTTGHWSQGYTMFCFKDDGEFIIGSFPWWRTANAIGFPERRNDIIDQLDDARNNGELVPPSLWRKSPGRELPEVDWLDYQQNSIVKHNIIFTRPEFCVDNRSSLDDLCPNFPFILGRSFVFPQTGNATYLVLELQYDETKAYIPDERRWRINCISREPFEVPQRAVLSTLHWQGLAARDTRPTHAPLPSLNANVMLMFHMINTRRVSDVS